MMTQEQSIVKASDKVQSIPATAIIIFGASGDLAARKLLPAIYNLKMDKLLPEDFYIIGFGRTALADESFRRSNQKNIAQFSRRPFSDEYWKTIEENTYFFEGRYDDLAAFEKLQKQIKVFEKKLGTPLQLLFYISTPPQVFRSILKNLGSSGLASHHVDSTLASKVIIEKPFGHNLSSARSLNLTIQRYFKESQVFRIDHYLGKETVQDLLVQRFANTIFEPIWNVKYVDYVEITVAESIGIGSRGGYYDKSGALRDMIQNHTMQLLALIAMEPPASIHHEAIRDEKVKLLKAIEPLQLKVQGGDAIRGQYKANTEEDKALIAYRDEDKVNPDSSTETYAALTACH